MELWCNHNFNTQYHSLFFFTSCLFLVFRYTLNATSMKQERRKKCLIIIRNRWTDQLSGSYIRPRSWFLFTDQQQNISVNIHMELSENHKDYIKVIKIRWHFGYYIFKDRNLSLYLNKFVISHLLHSSQTRLFIASSFYILYRLLGVMFLLICLRKINYNY